LATPRNRKAAPRIYCAGPLFNRGEREEMAEIARTLEGASFSTFLPHRDVFVFEEVHREFLRGGYDSAEATRMVQQAIFWVDAYEVLSACQGLVLNLNGRVPDEGAVAEAGMAWTAGKPIVLYKGDSRSLIEGSDNPILLGLGGFVKVSTIPEIAYAFAQLFRSRRPGKAAVLPEAVRRDVEPGRRLSKLLAGCLALADTVPLIASLFRSPRRIGAR